MFDESIFVTRWGSTGQKVVMVHGSAQGSKVGGDRHFAAQGVLAERGWQVIVPDRPGHGRSPAPGRGEDAEVDGQWVAELLAEGAHLVGHSFGGCVALSAAARSPEAVRSLTLIEPAMLNFAKGDPRVQQFGRQLGEALTGASGPGDMATRFASLVRIPPEIRGGSSEEELREMGKGLMQLKLPSEEMLREQLDQVKRHGIPLLVVTGGWNPGFEGVADAVADAGAGRHVVISSEHHFPQLILPDFNNLLEEFMAESEPRIAVRL